MMAAIEIGTGAEMINAMCAIAMAIIAYLTYKHMKGKQ